MRGAAIASTAVLTLAAVPAAAQDQAAAQTANTYTMAQLIGALKAQDVAAIARVDQAIDYAPDSATNATIAPDRMAAMFSGCTPQPIRTARRIGDTMILKFACPGRKAQAACATGDLELMLFRQPALSLGVIEQQRAGAECKGARP